MLPLNLWLVPFVCVTPKPDRISDQLIKSLKRLARLTTILRT